MKTRVAVQGLRKLRGGAQSQLMCCQEGDLWVVKFRNNPQGSRILVNEFLATRLAQTIGLNVPEVTIIDVPSGLIESSSELAVTCCGVSLPYSDGLNFASRFAGGLTPGLVAELLPVDDLLSVQNIDQFAGMMAFDKWTGNTDNRQTVFQRDVSHRQYTVQFIDQGNCFDGDAWEFRAGPLHGIYRTRKVYENVLGWKSFEPWLDRIEALNAHVLQTIAGEIPPAWYGWNTWALEDLISRLLNRRRRVRTLIEDLKDSCLSPFPRWTGYVRQQREN